MHQTPGSVFARNPVVDIGLDHDFAAKVFPEIEIHCIEIRFTAKIQKKKCVLSRHIWKFANLLKKYERNICFTIQFVRNFLSCFACSWTENFFEASQISYKVFDVVIYFFVSSQKSIISLDIW